MFLKTVLKKLRNKLLIKVLEKQDELSAKTEDATRLTLSKLSEVGTSLKEDLTSLIARLTAMQSSLEKTVVAKTETISNVASAQLSEVQSSLEKTVDAKTAVLADATLAKLSEVQSSIKKALVEQPTPVLLKAEKGLQNYLRLLKSLSERYTTIIAVKDTTGMFLTDEIAVGIKELGFTVDLSFEKGQKKYHLHTYIGVIDRGQTICETLSKQKEPSYYTVTREGISYEVISESHPGIAVIKIDGIDYATNRSGLNIVVFDQATKTLIDSVSFNTHCDALYCSRLENIVNGLQRKMDALLLGGYTVPQYCIDNKIANVVIYTESEYWNIAENICISFSLNHKVNIRMLCTTRPFARLPLDDNKLFLFSNFIYINDVKLIANDIVLIIHPNPQTDILKKFEAYGARVITLNQIATEMYNYIFNGVRALLDYSVKRLDIKIICYRMPVFPTKDWSLNEREIKEKGLTRDKIARALKNGQLITHAFDDLHYMNEELIELFTAGERVYNPNGELVLKDKASRLVNYANGRRVTTDQPSQRKRSIFGLGKCHATGIYSPDDKTIWSYMQRRFNEDMPELGIAMENYGLCYVGFLNDGLRKLSYIPVKPNDIILTDIWAPEYFPSIDLKDLFQRPHNYGEVFIDQGHYNENGYRAIADALFNSLP
jgi:hypothetical protein